MDEKKLLQMAEGIARIEEGLKNQDRRSGNVEQLVEKTNGTVIKMDKTLTVLETWKENVDKWRDSVDGNIDNMKSDLQRVQGVSLFGGMSKFDIIKVAGIIIAALVAGNAGGASILDLIKLLLGLGQ